MLICRATNNNRYVEIIIIIIIIIIIVMLNYKYHNKRAGLEITSDV